MMCLYSQRDREREREGGRVAERALRTQCNRSNVRDLHFAMSGLAKPGQVVVAAAAAVVP